MQERKENYEFITPLKVNEIKTHEKCLNQDFSEALSCFYMNQIIHDGHELFRWEYRHKPKFVSFYSLVSSGDGFPEFLDISNMIGPKSAQMVMQSKSGG